MLLRKDIISQSYFMLDHIGRGDKTLGNEDCITVSKKSRRLIWNKDFGRQSKRLLSLRSWVRFSLGTQVKRVSQRSAERRGFSL